MIETRALEHLLAVAKHLHFGRASRELGIGQPALSKSIQRLEAALGAKLLDRSRKKVRLTQIGRAVVERALRLVADARELKREVGLLLGGEIGTLAIGVGPAMGESYVSAAIARIAEKHPKTRILVRTDHWSQLSDWLFDGQLDLFVADVTELRKDDRVSIIRLPAEAFIWFCRCQHPLASARRVTRKDLLSYPLATPKMPAWAVEWFAMADPEGTLRSDGSYGTVECESYSILKRMVLASNCISAALHSTIVQELQSGALVALPIKSPMFKTNAGIVLIQDRTISPIAHAFVTEVLSGTGLNRG